MRVIAGKYKSRQLKTVRSSYTRPTTDRNKENMFNMIGPYFQGGIVLDLFAGSGGLGIEAISRGCNYLYSVDHQYEAYKVILENMRSLHIENAKVLKMDYRKALQYLKKQEVMFDYIFLDPPYGKKMIDGIFDFLMKHEMLHDGCLILVEELREEKFHVSHHFVLKKRHHYGITSLSIFEYKKE